MQSTKRVNLSPKKSIQLSLKPLNTHLLVLSTEIV